MIYIKLNKLRRIMKEKGLNQSKLSKLIGVDQAVISRIMNGRRISIGPKTICGILNNLHLKFDDIFFYDKHDCNTGKIRNKTNKSLACNPSDLPQVESTDHETGNQITKEI
jgi:transcriptional regulator with XRE-family HTH domain